MDGPNTEIRVFESSDVTDLVGVPPATLNTYVERRQFGIVPSVRSESGRGGRRIFSEADVFGIGLVWWLFESGLRSQTIQLVLDQTKESPRKSTANDAAGYLVESKKTILVVARSPRKDAKKAECQKIHLLYSFGELKFDSKSANSVLFVPIGNLFARLEKAIADFRS